MEFIYGHPLVTVAAISLPLFLWFWIHQLNKQGRRTLIRGLRTLDLDRREELLKKFTPSVQTELRNEPSQDNRKT